MIISYSGLLFNRFFITVKLRSVRSRTTVSLTKNVFPFMLNDEIINRLKSIIIEKAVDESVKNNCLQQTLEHYDLTSDMIDSKNMIPEKAVYGHFR